MSISFEEAGAMLDEIAAELPEPFYNRLNGGVLLLPEVKYHHQSVPGNDLYTMGEYRVDPLMGRYIVIYYGSFMRVFPSYNAERMRGQLRHTLLHEFTHHLESLAGEKGLEIKDAEMLRKYLNRQ